MIASSSPHNGRGFYPVSPHGPFPRIGVPFLGLLACFLLLCLTESMAICADIRIAGKGLPAILVEGEIVTGDSLKLKRLLKEVNVPRGKNGEVIFDSPGGNFMEGIYMGMEIFDKGWATRVREDAICLSACATAFLGGRYKIRDSGWLPDRNLEAGATLGFHSFYVEDNVQGSVAKSLNAGKNITNIFYAYANMLGIRPDVLVKMLDMEPDRVLIANTPDILRDLSINITGMKGSARNIFSVKGAINASIYLIAQNQPLLLNENENNWRLKPIAFSLGVDEFKNEMLRRFMTQLGEGETTGISAILAGGLGKGGRLNDVYNALQKLNLVPEVGSGDKIVKVGGLGHANPFMNKTAYIIGKNEGTKNFAVDYMLCAGPEAGGCEMGCLKKYGEIIYELLPRDDPLWQIK